MIITHIVGIILAVKETVTQFSDRIRQFISLFYNTYVQKALKILEKALLIRECVNVPFEEELETKVSNKKLLLSINCSCDKTREEYIVELTCVLEECTSHSPSHSSIIDNVKLVDELI